MRDASKVSRGDEEGNPQEFTEEQDVPVGPEEAPAFSEAVLHSSDWTVETIVSQLIRRNIDINPRFQRRDAWDNGKKGRLIESIILGLPIPQIVLAERKAERGRYIVLDGKQRLLTLMQYTGAAEGPKNSFGLSGLEVRTDLARKKFGHLESDPALEADLNAFNNYTIRAVVIRNWPDTEFLHLVFVRLNTGTVKLSPQELRQALFPGEFSNYVDDWSAESSELQSLLGRASADPRMRDVELLARTSHHSGRRKVFSGSPDRMQCCQACAGVARATRRSGRGESGGLERREDQRGRPERHVRRAPGSGKRWAEGFGPSGG